MKLSVFIIPDSSVSGDGHEYPVSADLLLVLELDLEVLGVDLDVLEASTSTSGL